MSEVEKENKISRVKAQEGGFRLRQELHMSEPTLDGHLQTLEVLRQAKEGGMRRATVMSPEGPITISIDEMISVVERLVEGKVGKLPPKES